MMPNSLCTCAWHNKLRNCLKNVYRCHA
jgi:hypothetical protein